MIISEFKKSIFTKTRCIIYVLLLIVLAVFTFISTVHRDKTAIDFYKKMNGRAQYEKLAALSDEYSALYNSAFYYEDDVFVDNSKILETEGKYTPSRYDDMLLLREIRNIKDSIDERKQQTETILEAGGRARLYYDNEQYLICDHWVVETLMGQKYYPLIACMITIIAAVAVMTVDNRKMISLCVTKKGLNAIVFSKVMAVGIVALISSVAAFLFFVGAVFAKTGFSVWELLAPAFYASDFLLCGSGLTVIGYLLFELLITVFFAFFIAEITMLLEAVIGKWKITMLISMVLVAGMTAIETLSKVLFENGFDTRENYIISKFSFFRLYEVLKKVNPFSLIDIRYYFEQPRFISTVWGTLDNIFVVTAFCGLGIIISNIVIFAHVQYPKERIK